MEAHALAPTDASLLSPEITARLAKLDLLARRLPEARRRGRRRTRRVGAGTDAIDKRGYVPGDDVRRIDWSAFARFERLLVRVVADEAPLRLCLLVDTSASMGFGEPTKLRQALRVGAALAAVAVGSEDRVAAVQSSPRPRTIARARGGRGGLAKLLAGLDPLTASGETDLAASAPWVRSALCGRGLCAVLSDLWDPAGALAGARVLRAHGHDVVLVRVLTPFERDLSETDAELDGLTLEDAESGQLLELPPSGVRAAYEEAFEAHEAELRAGAEEVGAPLLSVSTEDAFDDIVFRALASGLLRTGSTR